MDKHVGEQLGGWVTTWTVSDRFECDLLCMFERRDM